MSTTHRGTPASAAKRRPQSENSGIASPSGIPVPRGAAPSPAADSGAYRTADPRRRNQAKKDEAIRRKLEHDLNKKRTAAAVPGNGGGASTPARTRHTKKIQPGTVSALRPAIPLTVHPSITVSEASQLMAAKREDCVLVVDEQQQLAGIFTAKDLAYRVVGQGVDARDVRIESIMTKNPLCTQIDTSATEALNLMVSRGFRHLPVTDLDGDVCGILDITKCFYEAMEKLERQYAASRKLFEAMEGVQNEWGSSQQPAQILEYVETLRQKMSGPDLSTVLDGTPPVVVTVRTSVAEAAALMREHHTTAVLVMERDSIAGIFTSKDVVLRVIAAGLDPHGCSVVRVMTPHPDCASQSLSISAALRKMNDGHYLNLPVVDDQEQIVGMVDVLRLTYATLEQMNAGNNPESEGPMWNRFWNTLGDEDSDSVVSDGVMRATPSDLTGADEALRAKASVSRLSYKAEVEPAESASQIDAAAKAADAASAKVPSDEVPFAFKFKAPSGRTHRFQICGKEGHENFRNLISEKLGAEVDELGGIERYCIAYVDDESDVVEIMSKQDIIDAVDLARRQMAEKVDLLVHHPDVNAQGLVPSERKATTRAKNANNSNNKPSSDLVAGVPNEILLPCSLGLLAAVIIGMVALKK